MKPLDFQWTRQVKKKALPHSQQRGGPEGNDVTCKTLKVKSLTWRQYKDYKTKSLPYMTLLPTRPNTYTVLIFRCTHIHSHSRTCMCTHIHTNTKTQTDTQTFTHQTTYKTTEYKLQMPQWAQVAISNGWTAGYQISSFRASITSPQWCSWHRFMALPLFIRLPLESIISASFPLSRLWVSSWKDFSTLANS